MSAGPPTLFEPPPPAPLRVEEAPPRVEEAPPAAAPPADPPPRPTPRLRVAPCSVADALRVERELGVSHPVAQVLVRRGFADPDAARKWLAADEAHDASRFAGIHDAVGLVLR